MSEPSFTPLLSHGRSLGYYKPTERWSAGYSFVSPGNANGGFFMNPVCPTKTKENHTLCNSLSIFALPLGLLFTICRNSIKQTLFRNLLCNMNIQKASFENIFK
jgi:hypothetical protein